MRKALLIGVVSLALAAPAEAAVTLDPGTGLTVTCDAAHPFRGSPFTLTDTTEALPLTGRYPGSHRRFWTHSDKNEGGDAFARIRVKRLKRGTFRVGLIGNRDVTWAGC